MLGETKHCIGCGEPYVVVGTRQKFCTKPCGSRHRHKLYERGTEYQYNLVSGDWRRYYQRRVGERGRSASLSVDDLLALHAEQGGRCALSGVEMTCVLVRGKPCPSNASLDRIVAGGPYTKDNIRLVCTAVNSLRGNLSTAEFVDWCRKVADNFDKGK